MGSVWLNKLQHHGENSWLDSCPKDHHWGWRVRHKRSSGCSHKSCIQARLWKVAWQEKNVVEIRANATRDKCSLEKIVKSSPKHWTVGPKPSSAERTFFISFGNQHPRIWRKSGDACMQSELLKLQWKVSTVCDGLRSQVICWCWCILF